MLEDKRRLSERCDLLQVQMEANERKHTESARAAEQRHVAEVRRIKSLAETSAKVVTCRLSGIRD